MGTYNSFTMDVTIPAEGVAPLAADLREMLEEGSWYPEERIAAASDADLIAWMLFEVEGGSDGHAAGPGPDFTEDVLVRREDGSLVIQSGGHGKLSWDSDKVEGLYAAAGATGTIECELDDGISGRYVSVFRNGGVEVYEAEVVYPSTDRQAKAVRLFCTFLQGGSKDLRASADLLDALLAVSNEARMQGEEGR